MGEGSTWAAAHSLVHDDHTNSATRILTEVNINVKGKVRPRTSQEATLDVRIALLFP